VCAASVELWHEGACVARHERCLRSGAQSLRARAGGTFCGAGELGRLRTEYRSDEREGSWRSTWSRRMLLRPCRPGIDACRRHHLSQALVQMARELRMNPETFGTINNHE
jgi:hypothetical protein